MMLQAVKDYEQKYILIIAFFRRYRFNDDMFFGADSLEELLKMVEQIVAFMGEMGVELNK